MNGRWMKTCARRIAGAVVLSTVVAVVSGCATFNTSATTTVNGPRMQGPSPMQHSLLQNIPVPAGFQLVPDQTVAKKSGAMRIALCVFEGSTNLESVARFYQNYMPSAKFSLRKEDFVHGRHQMRFESDTEECSVRFWRDGSKTTLVIDLGPLAKGSAERKALPPALPR